jgi:hypothetical protein
MWQSFKSVNFGLGALSKCMGLKDCTHNIHQLIRLVWWEAAVVMSSWVPEFLSHTVTLETT